MTVANPALPAAGKQGPFSGIGKVRGHRNRRETGISKLWITVKTSRKAGILL
jgi:hypothetical protein